MIMIGGRRRAVMDEILGSYVSDDRFVFHHLYFVSLDGEEGNRRA